MPRYLACARSGRTHHAVALTADARIVWETPLPGRGHAIAANGREAVVVARRPGRFALVLDLGSGRALRRIDAVPGRHFYGHGAFAGRRLFYASENAYDEETGVIGVYDAGDGYRRLGELPAHGIGPHELAMMPDGETLAVAVGGILTHPDIGRQKLNIPEMAPALVYLDRRTGTLAEKRTLSAALHKLGIRHLAVAPDGAVALAGQYEGPSADRVPLVGLHRRGRAITLFDAPPAVLARMRNYCGGVAFGAGGRTVAVTSPRGGLVTVWSAASGTLERTIELADGCGVAPAVSPGAFVLSNGNGDWLVEAARGRGLAGRARSDRQWDNHIAGVAAGA